MPKPRRRSSVTHLIVTTSNSPIITMIRNTKRRKSLQHYETREPGVDYMINTTTVASFTPLGDITNVTPNNRRVPKILTSGSCEVTIPLQVSYSCKKNIRLPLHSRRVNITHANNEASFHLPIDPISATTPSTSNVSSDVSSFGTCLTGIRDIQSVTPTRTSRNNYDNNTVRCERIKRVNDQINNTRVNNHINRIDRDIRSVSDNRIVRDNRSEQYKRNKPATKRWDLPILNQYNTDSRVDCLVSATRLEHEEGTIVGTGEETTISNIPIQGSATHSQHDQVDHYRELYHIRHGHHLRTRLSKVFQGMVHDTLLYLYEEAVRDSTCLFATIIINECYIYVYRMVVHVVTLSCLVVYLHQVYISGFTASNKYEETIISACGLYLICQHLQEHIGNTSDCLVLPSTSNTSGRLGDVTNSFTEHDTTNVSDTVVRGDDRSIHEVSDVSTIPVTRELSVQSTYTREQFQAYRYNHVLSNNTIAKYIDRIDFSLYSHLLLPTEQLLLFMPYIDFSTYAYKVLPIEQLHMIKHMLDWNVYSNQLLPTEQVKIFKSYLVIHLYYHYSTTEQLVILRDVIPWDMYTRLYGEVTLQISEDETVTYRPSIRYLY